MRETLYLIDGHSQIFRAYYAPFRDLHSPSGEPTRATYVFCSMLLKLLREKSPTYLVMTMDNATSSDSRRAIYADYKSTRQPPPEDLLPQIERIISILQLMKVPVITVPSYESDDVIATLARCHPELDVYVVSKDKDLEQLINAHVRLYDPSTDELVDEQRLLEKKGYRPDQAIDVQTLMGDTVDDIPGIPGVGPKTAVKLIQKYGSAEGVLDHVDELTPKMRSNVSEFKGQLPITRALVTLRSDLDVSYDLKEARTSQFSLAAARGLLEELGFNRLVQQIDAEDHAEGTHPGNQGSVSLSLVCPVPEGRYDLIDSESKLMALVDQLKRVECFAFDTETTELNPVAANIAGVSLSWQSGVACYIPIRAAVGDTLQEDFVRNLLGPVFENERIRKCGHNVKYDRIVLSQMGIRVCGVVFDSMIASFLLDPLRRSHSLDALAFEFFGHRMIPITDLIGKGKSQISIDQVDTTAVGIYASEDADYTWRLYEQMLPQIRHEGFESLMNETEIPLIEVLAEMELNGVALDLPLLSKMGEELEHRLGNLTKKIHESAGYCFNVDSPKQLSRVLFDELNLRVVRKTQTGRSTDAETLTALARESSHPLPALVLDYRELAKLKSTYVDNLPRMICRKTGRVHASYNMIGAVTGRLSSNDPNLQNIPIRTETGRLIRKAFIPSRPGYVLLVADYSQIELRMLAHFSQDPTLLTAFLEDRDIHATVAAQLAGVSIDQVSTYQRSQAKAVNFGIIYGQTAYGLSRTTGMSPTEAQQFIDLYFQKYPGVQKFIHTCIEHAQSQGSVSTILGRKRHILEINSRNRQKRMLGERLAVNTVLQGSAADLIKKAMVMIHNSISAEGSPARMLIQVHDELVFELPRDAVETETVRIREAMTTALPLDVPLRVDIGWGPNWLESKT